MPKVKLYDTTLRDGSQAEGISYSVMDKVRIAQELDKFGIHFIEGGWPGSNPKDKEFFEKISKANLKNSKITAFSMTRRPNITASCDSNIKALLKSKAQVMTIVGKTWDFHVTDVLKTTLEENLEMIKDTISFLVKEGFDVFYDAEHFFDAYNANKDYSLKTLLAMIKAREPRSLKICAFLSKDDRREVEVPIDYLGFHIPDVWVEGYGLDSNGAGRGRACIIRKN